jgi:hypothetical protein
MRHPRIYTAHAIKNWSSQAEIKKGVWIPARPMAGSFSFLWRFKLAYSVFIGKYDALNWQDDKSN